MGPPPKGNPAVQVDGGVPEDKSAGRNLPSVYQSKQIICRQPKTKKQGNLEFKLKLGHPLSGVVSGQTRAQLVCRLSADFLAKPI